MAMAVAEAKRGSAGTTRVGHSGTVRCNGRREVRKRRTRSEPRAGVTKETTAEVMGSNEGGEEHRMLLRVDDEAALVRANGRTGAQRAVSRSFKEADTLFIDAYTCGIAGDMLCAALLNLGVVPLDVIERGLRSLASEFTGGVGTSMARVGWHVDVGTSIRNGVVAPIFEVIEHDIDDEEYLTRHRNRCYRDIKAMLRGVSGGITPGAVTIAHRAFEALAVAEADVHGMDVGSVHFHEVGCIDSIVDIVTAAIAIDFIGAAHVVVSPLPMGRGIIRGAAHGPLPCPAPATLQVICAAGIPTYDAGIDFELVTPTGACIAAALSGEREGSPVASTSRWPAMVPLATGYGCGSKQLSDRANVLRVVLGKASDSAARAEKQSAPDTDGGGLNLHHHHHGHHGHGHGHGHHHH